MTLMSQDRFLEYDFALDGVGYMLEWTADNPVQLVTADKLLERTQFTNELEQNYLDTLYWGQGGRSWHEGEGQVRAEIPLRISLDPTTGSSPYKFWRSRGVDITTRGQLTLLHKTALVLSLSDQEPKAPQKIAATDTSCYVAAGQPNLQRFSALDGSDHAAVSTGTESGLDVLDLTTDGTVVYIALSGDGVHLVAAPNDTQIEAFTSTSGWTYNVGTGAPSSTTYNYNGTNWAEKALLADYSTVNTFTIWVQVQGAASGHPRLAFLNDASNYFIIDLATTLGTLDTGLIQLSIPRTAFVAVGSPVWSAINDLVVVTAPGATATTFDDLRDQVGAAGAHWCDWDTRALGWAKDRVFGAGIKSGSTWRFFEAASGAGSNEIYVLPTGWQVTDICELGGNVYFSAFNGSIGRIYYYDGTNAPIVAAPADALGEGTIPLSLTPFAGAGILIGTRRIAQTGAGGLGLLYRGFPDAAGALRLEKVVEFGQDDGRDYGIRCGSSYGDLSYWGMNYADASAVGANFLTDTHQRSGLGMYWPETGAWSRSFLTAPGSDCLGIIEDTATFKGHRVFTVGAVGVFIEQDIYEPEGGVCSSLYDVNVAADKNWMAMETVYQNPEAIANPVAHAHSVDALTWTDDTAAGDATVTRLRTSLSSLNVRGPSQYVRTRLMTTSGTVSPVLNITGIGGWPTSSPLPTFVLTVRSFPDSQDRSLQSTHNRDQGYTVLAAMLALWQNQSIVDFQPPWYRLSLNPDGSGGTSYKVRVTDIQQGPGWGVTGDRQGGILNVKLKVCP